MRALRDFSPCQTLVIIFSAVCFGATPKLAAQSQPSLSTAAQASHPEYSKEDLVIEKLNTEVTFAADGTQVWDQSVVVRIQSDAGVRRFGVLTFPYSAVYDTINIAYVRVRKADGRIVETPRTNIQDLASEVARSAPTYSDLREKQIPVKGLGSGDVLEYSAHSTRTKPEVSGQFWFEQSFVKDAVVLDEELRLTVPADKYVNVKSPSLQPAVSEENGRKIYFWKTAQLEHPKPADPKNQATPAPAPSVQLTTFKSWEEVGQWYRQLAEPKAEVTDAVRAKATELTKGLTTDADKKKALYNYVSSKFRYIAVSFGSGRYQPHTADEVLANQYGDCKDKHTLLAALLKAAGIEAWPALISAERKLDPDVPSPAQFNHLITVLPGDKERTWLDTTPEVAPYGLLLAGLRDKQALVIPAGTPAALMTTPADPPFRSFENLEVKAQLSADGALTGRMEFNMRGDSELVFRSLFHVVAPTQWQELVQRVSYGLGFRGTVSAVEVENLENDDEPLRFSYDYQRKDYSDWANKRITPPFPLFTLSRDPDGDTPAEPFELGPKCEYDYRVTLRLPAGFTIELPESAKAQAGVISYSATYSLQDGSLVAERRLVVNQAKAPASAWADYVKFGKAVLQDEGHLLQLTAGSGAGPVVAVQGNTEAEEQVRQGFVFLKNHAFESARKAFAAAERLNPQQRNLWWGYGNLFRMQNQIDQAVEALQKEIQYHPENTTIYRMVATLQAHQLKHTDAAVKTLRALLKAAPGDLQGALQLAALLMSSKHYTEAVDVARKALETSPDDAKLQLALAQALVHTDTKDEGVAALRKIGDASTDGYTLNSVAWALTDTGADAGLGKQFAERAIALLEEQSAKVTLGGLQSEDLRRVHLLGATWDTLGWAYFKLGDLERARRYVNAAWMLVQDGECADHLGQLYEKQGQPEEARHAYQLALAAQAGMPDTRERLEKLGPDKPRPAILKNGHFKGASKPAGDFATELGKLRTTAIPGLESLKGSGEFFVLFSAHGVQDVQFISGEESIGAAKDTLLKAHYDMPFPDDGPEKIARRGILSCSAYTTPRCQFVFLRPSDTTK